jgi:hypothetical protein
MPVKIEATGSRGGPYHFLFTPLLGDATDDTDLAMTLP